MIILAKGTPIQRGLEADINWDEVVYFMMPRRYGKYKIENIDVSIEGGFEINGDIEIFGIIEFGLSPETGFLVAIGFEEVE